MVKVLKALTLDRMGKRAEAMALADSVRVQNPSDEHTLSTLALVYKVTLRGAVACSWREGLHQRQLVFLSSAAPRESSPACIRGSSAPTSDPSTPLTAARAGAAWVRQDQAGGGGVACTASTWAQGAAVRPVQQGT